MHLRARLLAFGVALALAGAAPSPVCADEAVYKRLVNSTVFMYCEGTVDGKSDAWSGSGVLVSGNHVLTNHHVVSNAETIFVFFRARTPKGAIVTDIEEYFRDQKGLTALGIIVPGTCVAKDSRRDLAVVRIDSAPAFARAVWLAEQSASPGEEVQGVGNSGRKRGALFGYHTGAVRLVHDWNCGNNQTRRVLELQSAQNHGDSGGPLVNAECVLVGVVSETESKIKVDVVPTKDGKAVVVAEEANRNVDLGVDILEIRAFLDENKVPYNKRRPGTELLAGTFRTTWTKDGQSGWFDATFAPDPPLTEMQQNGILPPGGKETMTFRTQAGDVILSFGAAYTYDDADFTVSVNGAVSQRATLRWLDEDRFVYHIVEDKGDPNAGGREHTFERLEEPSRTIVPPEETIAPGTVPKGFSLVSGAWVTTGVSKGGEACDLVYGFFEDGSYVFVTRYPSSREEATVGVFRLNGNRLVLMNPQGILYEGTLAVADMNTLVFTCEGKAYAWSRRQK